MEKKILVIYVGVVGIRSEDIGDITRKIVSRIVPETFQGEIIVIPTQSVDTRIECIDPKYITEEELVREHTELMKKLNEELRYQAEQLRQTNNE